MGDKKTKGDKKDKGDKKGKGKNPNLLELPPDPASAVLQAGTSTAVWLSLLIAAATNYSQLEALASGKAQPVQALTSFLTVTLVALGGFRLVLGLFRRFGTEAQLAAQEEARRAAEEADARAAAEAAEEGPSLALGLDGPDAHLASGLEEIDAEIGPALAPTAALAGSEQAAA